MSYLSADKLCESHRRNQEQTLPSRGAKYFEPTYSWMEKKEISTSLDERKKVIDAERVEKASLVSIAKWLPEINVAEVTRRVGKQWPNYGFERGGKLNLQPEEALFLLETSLLELHYGDVPLSIEQAYGLLLGPHCTLAEYRTYAKLHHCGFLVMRHVPTTRKLLKRSFDVDEIVLETKKQKLESSKSVNTKIEIINLEDDDDTNALSFIPNMIGKDSVRLQIPPKDLIPENIQPNLKEYIINIKNLVKAGCGSKPKPPSPAPSPVVASNYNNNSMQPFWHRNYYNPATYPTNIPTFQWQIYRAANYYPRRPNYQHLNLRNYRNLAFMTPRSDAARFNNPSNVRFDSQFRNRMPFMQQRNPQVSRMPYMQQRNPQVSREQQENIQNTVVTHTQSNPSVPKIAADSWSKVKHNLVNSVEIITLDNDDEIHNEANIMDINEPVVKPEDCKSLDTVLTKLKIFKPQPTETTTGKLTIKFDAFQHNHGFRKTDPGIPSYHVVVVSPTDSIPHDCPVGEKNVTVLYAVVQYDSVNFYSLEPVNLPTLN